LLNPKYATGVDGGEGREEKGRMGMRGSGWRGEGRGGEVGPARDGWCRSGRTRG